MSMIGRSTHARIFPPLVLALAVVLPACDTASRTASPPSDTSGGGPAVDDAEVVVAAEAMPTAGIEVGAAAVESRAATFDAPAVVQLDESRTARIGSLVEGIVLAAEGNVGDRVRAGGLLATMHSHLAHDAWAGYRRTTAERRQASTELAYMRDAEARATRLLASKAIAAQEAERARVDRVQAEEALTIAESEVTRALNELEHLGIDPPADERTASGPDEVPVTSPIAGVILERLVTPGTAVTVGTPLFVVSDLSHLWVTVEIDEGRLASLDAESAAAMTVPAYPGRTFAARIAAVGDVVNAETRRVTIRLAIDNRDGALKPQMFATVRVPMRGGDAIVVVPASAVQKIDDRSAVFVERGSGRFALRPVAIGEERDGRVHVVSGLQPGERIVTAGSFLLKSRLLDTGPRE